MVHLLCLEGTKGAGKSTTVGMVSDALSERGYDVFVEAPFARANEFAAFAGFGGAWPMANASVKANREEVAQVMSLLRQGRARLEAAAEADRPVVLVQDRGWVTLWFHLHEGALGRSPDCASEVRDTWAQVLAEAPPTFFLYADVETTRRRRPSLDEASGLETDFKLGTDLIARIGIVNRHEDKVVGMFDTTANAQSEVVDAIVGHVMESASRHLLAGP